MGALDLAGSLSLNVTPWQASLGRANAQVTKFADHVERDFGKKINKLFGVGLFAGLIYSPLQKMMSVFTSGPVEAARKLSEDAAAKGLDPETFQAATAAAKAQNMTLDEWLSNLRAVGTPLEQVTKQVDAFRGAVELTNEQVENLAAQDFWNDVQKWWGPKLASGVGFVHDAIALWRLKAGGMTLDDAAAAIKESKVQDALNRGAEGRAGLAQAFDSVKRGGAFKSDFAINEWQQLGAFVGGGSSGSDHVAVIAEEAKRQTDLHLSTIQELKEIKDSLKGGNFAPNTGFASPFGSFGWH